jgi:hypothetical protein
MPIDRWKLQQPPDNHATAAVFIEPSRYAVKGKRRCRNPWRLKRDSWYVLGRRQISPRLVLPQN